MNGIGVKVVKYGGQEIDDKEAIRNIVNLFYISRQKDEALEILTIRINEYIDSKIEQRLYANSNNDLG